MEEDGWEKWMGGNGWTEWMEEVDGRRWMGGDGWEEMGRRWMEGVDGRKEGDEDEKECKKVGDERN